MVTEAAARLDALPMGLPCLLHTAWVRPAGTELTVGDQFVAGAGAGVATSLLACPMELIKCRLQAQPAGASLQVSPRLPWHWRPAVSQPGHPMRY
jgi:hypothetical protein